MRIASHSIVVGFAWLAATVSTAAAQDAPSKDNPPQPPSAVNAAAFRVPDGSPAEILDFIQKIRKLPPPGRELPEVVEHLQKVHGAVIEAVDKLGVGGNPAAVASAVEFILEGLHLNRKLNKDAGTGPAKYHR